MNQVAFDRALTDGEIKELAAIGPDNRGEFHRERTVSPFGESQPSKPERPEWDWKPEP